MKKLFLLLSVPFLLWQCTTKKPNMDTPNISKESAKKVTVQLVDKFGETQKERINKGVNHAASLWRTSDGTEADFAAFCEGNFIAKEADLDLAFNKISGYFESIWGHFNEMSLGLTEHMHLSTGDKHPVDDMFAAYSPGAHISSDFYTNKIAFVIALNFPPFTLEEKNSKGKDWNSKEWAYARLGDVFTSRVPSHLSQAASAAETNADIYIGDYNIKMGHLLNDKGEKIFPEKMSLLTHWNLRDEIKSNYSNKENGQEKQEMIYKVMNRIIDQSIPEKVINNPEFDWDPYANKLYKDGNEVEFTSEPNTRYLQIVNSFRALKAIDEYEPELNTYIKRKFSGSMEIPQEEVEALFDTYLSSPQAKEVGKLISKRLGRDLRPFDIWYDGFKARSSIDANKLNGITQKKYPNAKAMEKDLVNMLLDLGWEKERAASIASKIAVDPARGSGHAWGAQMKTGKAHLRTRIPETGMDYKGYNIAVHELGHNVEQTISIQDVDYYMLNGVPNTAFTEALAFIFQARDLMLLGMKDNNPEKEYLKTLDNFWSMYEIMGVSMVDMKVWKWLYANPEANEAQLKDAVINIAKEVWNKYYADVFGIKDEPILAIYSHMVASPLYLSAYPYGHLVDFQVEQHLKGKDFSDEVDRIWKQGRLTPNVWMNRAVGNSVSNDPVLTSTTKALKHMAK